ncbi:head-tail connector protein [Mesorhizobium koreense]|uniref:head-tail connector protein n=1 Tax=Mesorhizobium koreense TaxID=3074855 RepID=UPI00287BBAF6|nr:head-tail connector protein [Mesorhizobium sp. WR6]
MTIVTPAELRAHSNLPEEDSDDFLIGKIAAAEDWCASYIGQALADLDPLPGAVKEAILKLAADLYELREASLVGTAAEILPLGVTDLLAPHRIWNF